MPLNHRSIAALARDPGRAASLSVGEGAPLDEPLSRLTADPRVELIVITGEEPFADRHGVAEATRRLAAAGKRIAVETRGSWAAHARVPGWVHDVLVRCACVVFHPPASAADARELETRVRAAREVVAAEAWLIVEVDASPGASEGARERAAALLTEAFGGRWDHHAELVTEPAMGELG